jgi:cytochrome P450
MQAEATAVRTARGRVPVLGHVASLRRRPVNFLVKLRAEGDLVRVYFGPRAVCVVNSPALIRQVLVSDRDKFEKGALFDKVEAVLGTSILTSNGAAHRQRRRLIQPVFRSDRVARYGEHMAELAGERAESWRPGRVLQVDREMHELTLSVVSRTLFASRVGRHAAAEIQRWLPVIVDGFIRRTLSPAVLVDRLPTPSNRRFDAARAGLGNVVDEVIRAYRSDPADHGDFLSTLIRTHDTGDDLTEAELRDELITMLLSGTETTAVALSWVFHELGRHPGIQERVHAEIVGVADGGGTPSERASRMEYTGRVLNEALRLRTPPWILMRRTLVEVDLGGRLLPPGTEIVISPTALHRDPALFANPLRFDPDRWLPDRAAALPRCAFIPFGSGDRQCIGDSYAMLEMKIVLAEIISRHRLRPASGRHVREVAGTVLRPSSVEMMAESRDA